MPWTYEKVNALSLECDYPDCEHELADIFTAGDLSIKKAEFFERAREDGWAVNGDECYCKNHVEYADKKRIKIVEEPK